LALVTVVGTARAPPKWLSADAILTVSINNLW
jgi:hypothetical protein